MTPKRIVLLVASAIGFISLLIIVAVVGPQRPPSKPLPASSAAQPESKETLVPYGGGVSVAASHVDLLRQGDQYGFNGDWPKAFECFRQLIASGNCVEYEWGCATGSALAAGDTNACLQLCLKMMDIFGASTNVTAAERFAKQCLALPGCPDELLDFAAAGADLVIKKNRNSGWGQLIKGMAEYRQENWPAALDWLRQPEKSSDFNLSIMACCFGAMARYQTGDAAAARQALELADNRIKTLVRTGKLGSWNDIARAIGVRAEAEQLILGKVSPPIDPSQVIENRNKWQSIAFDLNTADQMGKQSLWAHAAEYYAKALKDPAFDWIVSEVRQDLTCQKMAAVFLMAGDQTNYTELVRSLLARHAEKLTPMMQERYAQIVICNTELLPPDLKSPALAYARRVCQLPNAETNPWLCLLRGATEYRDGHFDEAIAALNQASFGSAETDGAARAMTYKAMALKRLGQTKEALEATQKANALFAKSQARSGDWTNPAFYQLAMNELLALLATPVESPKT